MEEKTSKVKAKILELLADGEWVESASLLKIVKQKYFDRRIRELRDEQGFDIETGTLNGRPAYRLRSKRRLPKKVRTYLGEKEKKALSASLPATCALCGKPFSENLKKVFDHRVPLIRGGTGAQENYQLLCIHCNNQKRTQCRGCTVDCKSCYLAYPESFPPAIMLRSFNRDDYENLRECAKKLSLSVDEFCVSLIKDKLQRL